MNIGIDFDGVLFDTESIFRALAQFFDLQHGKFGMVAPEELKFQKRYNWPELLKQQFLDEMVDKVLKTAPVMPFAKNVLKALSKNNNIYAITSRGLVSKKEIIITEKRLKHEKIKLNKVFYSVTNKVELCKELNIDVMIEDLYDNVIGLANNNIKCLYYRDTVLKQCVHRNVTEVRNWGDIAVELESMGAIFKDDIII